MCLETDICFTTSSSVISGFRNLLYLSITESIDIKVSIARSLL